APAAPREPDGVRALAASQVQRGAGLQPGRLLDEDGVGLAAPDAVVLGVARVPEFTVRGVLHTPMMRRRSVPRRTALPFRQTGRARRPAASGPVRNRLVEPKGAGRDGDPVPPCASVRRG